MEGRKGGRQEREGERERGRKEGRDGGKKEADPYKVLTWVNKLWYIRYDSALKEKGVLTQAARWTDLEDVMQSEVRHKGTNWVRCLEQFNS